MVLNPFLLVRKWFNIVELDALFKFELLGLCFLHLLLAISFEYIVNGFYQHLPKFKIKTKYQKVKQNYEIEYLK